MPEDNKVSESKMAVTESNMAEMKLAAIIKLCQNEWVNQFCAKVSANLGMCEWVSEEKSKMAESKMVDCKMAAIIKLGENEWVWVRLN